MRDSVRAAFVDFTTKFEGEVPWMYLDVLGLVTIGIGNLIDPIQTAMNLPFIREDGSPADRAEIAAEWLRIKNHPTAARQGHRATEHVAKLRLLDDGVYSLVQGKLHQHDVYLRGRFPDFADWPADAQLATHSMAWACGPAFAFPLLATALRDGDFTTAASECHIAEFHAGVFNAGIVPRNKANGILYRNAATVRAGGLDPEPLRYPVDLSEEVTQPELVPSRRPPRIVDFAIVHPPVPLDHPSLDDDEEPPPKAA